MRLSTLLKRAKEKAKEAKQVVVQEISKISEPPKRSGIYEAVCIDQARNPQWIYVRIDGIDGRVAAVIPRRLTGKLTGKRVYVEAITDATGTSYRYVQSPQ